MGTISTQKAAPDKFKCIVCLEWRAGEKTDGYGYQCHGVYLGDPLWAHACVECTPKVKHDLEKYARNHRMRLVDLARLRRERDTARRQQEEARLSRGGGVAAVFGLLSTAIGLGSSTVSAIVEVEDTTAHAAYEEAELEACASVAMRTASEGAVAAAACTGAGPVTYDADGMPQPPPTTYIPMPVEPPFLKRGAGAVKDSSGAMLQPRTSGDLKAPSPHLPTQLRIQHDPTSPTHCACRQGSQRPCGRSSMTSSRACKLAVAWLCRARKLGSQRL